MSQATKRAGEIPSNGGLPQKSQDTGNHASMSKEEFLNIFEDLREQVVEEVKEKYEMPEEAQNHIRKMIDYNVPGGKLNRGITVVHTLDAIRGTELTAEEKYKAAALGWCVEWLQAFFLVADDIMDQSHTRRDQPCWFRNKDIGLNAINDSFILKSNIFQILKKHFRDYKCYTQLLELFSETTLQTELGQLMDLTSNPLNGPTDLDRFTKERHRLIVQYKTAYYSFYLPVALGMILGGVATDESLETAKSILVDMGIYFQVQDDYLDCYADPKVLGKIGTDIQDNKCSWLVVQALSRSNEEQKDVLKKNYGVDDPKCIDRVKQLYKELKLEEVYHNYEEKMYRDLCERIDAVDKNPRIQVPGEAFCRLLRKIYKRSK